MGERERKRGGERERKREERGGEGEEFKFHFTLHILSQETINVHQYSNRNQTIFIIITSHCRDRRES